MIRAGRPRGALGWWASNVARRQVTVAGIDPVAAGTVALVDRTYGRPLAGLAGTVVAGEGFSPGWKASLRFSYANLALMLPSTSSAGTIRSPNVALPSTTGDLVGLTPGGGSVTDSLAAIPPGVR